MAGRDPNRRVYGTQPLRRVGSGQERIDRELKPFYATMRDQDRSAIRRARVMPV